MHGLRLMGEEAGGGNDALRRAQMGELRGVATDVWVHGNRWKTAGLTRHCSPLHRRQIVCTAAQ